MTEPLTDTERALAANPELTARIERAIEDPAALVGRDRPRRVTTGGRPLARWRRPWIRRPRTYLILAVSGTSHADVIYTTDFGRLTPEHIDLIRDAFRKASLTAGASVTIAGVIELAPTRV